MLRKCFIAAVLVCVLINFSFAVVPDTIIVSAEIDSANADLLKLDADSLAILAKHRLNYFDYIIDLPVLPNFNFAVISRHSADARV